MTQKHQVVVEIEAKTKEEAEGLVDEIICIADEQTDGEFSGKMEARVIRTNLQ